MYRSHSLLSETISTVPRDQRKVQGTRVSMESWKSIRSGCVVHLPPMGEPQRLEFCFAYSRVKLWPTYKALPFALIGHMPAHLDNRQKQRDA